MGDSHGVVCFVGIGSNMNDPVNQCLKAVVRLSETSGIKHLRSSSLYKTEPVGSVEQMWFINTVAEIRVKLTPYELFNALQSVEKEMGRLRNEKWGPRIIDLDILLFGQEVVQQEDLIVPHPELHKRRFVLVPLCEIASYVIHPSFGVSIRGLMERLEDKSIVHLYEMQRYNA